MCIKYMQAGGCPRPKCRNQVEYEDFRDLCEKHGKRGHKVKVVIIEAHQITFPIEICKNCKKKDDVGDSTYNLNLNMINNGENLRAQSPASAAPSPGYCPPDVDSSAGRKTSASTSMSVASRQFYSSASEGEQWKYSSEGEEVQGKGKGKAVQGGGGIPSTPAGPSGGYAGRDKRKREGTSSGSAGGSTSGMSRHKKK